MKLVGFLYECRGDELLTALGVFDRMSMNGIMKLCLIRYDRRCSAYDVESDIPD